MSIEKTWYDVVFNYLSNPFSLLVIGAVISSYLIPRFTRRWQDHQDELQLKRQLVERISNSTVNVVLAVADAIKIPQEGLDKAEHDWHLECSSIGSYIEAYFYEPKINKLKRQIFNVSNKNEPIAHKWEAYYNVINQLLKLPNSSEMKKWDKFTYDLEKLIKEAKERIEDPNANDSPAKTPDDSSWLEQKQVVIYSLKHKLMHDIIKSKITGFSRF